MALASCLNAENVLLNIHGFSSFQFAIGQSPSLACAFNDKFPAITSTNQSVLSHQHSQSQKSLYYEWKF